jgi:hypothetical protein
MPARASFLRDRAVIKLEGRAPTKYQVCKVAALSLLGIWLAGDAKADFTAAEVNFIMADKDGDLLLDKAEVLEGTMSGFGAIDQDNDNHLSKQEVGDAIDEAEFADGESELAVGALSPFGEPVTLDSPV